jgi:hypothetical protein
MMRVSAAMDTAIILFRPILSDKTPKIGSKMDNPRYLNMDIIPSSANDAPMLRAKRGKIGFMIIVLER